MHNKIQPPSEACLQLTLTLRAPFITQAVGAMAHGIDAKSLIHKGKPALPGTLLRGAIKEALLLFQNTLASNAHQKAAHELFNLINNWFGKEGASTRVDESANKPTPESNQTQINFPENPTGDLVFDHFYYATQAPSDGTIRNRTEIDTSSGTVKDGSLVFIESAYPTGAIVEFTGNIWLSLPTPKNPQDITRCIEWLNKALEYIDALGSYKNVGFGKLINASVSSASTANTNTAKTLSLPQAKTNRHEFLLTPDRPFCIAKPHRSGNRFEAEEYIPGNAIKAIIAKRFNIGRKYPNAAISEATFNKLVVSHAYPIKPGDNGEIARFRPRYRPKSLVVAPNAADGKPYQAYDLAHQKHACLINNRAPAFETDWKSSDYGLADELVNTYWPEPSVIKKLLAVRTAISAATGVAEDEQLFSQELVDPENLRWHFYIDTQKLEDNEKVQVETLLKAILKHGLDKLGKTKARAEVEQFSSQESASAEEITINNLESNPLKDQQTIYLTLQSHAHILPDDHNVPGTNGSSELFGLYKNYFANTGFKLSHYFASQSVRGGDYQNHRFQKPGGSIAWLTDPGSLFALTVNDTSKAQEFLTQWLQAGLPPLIAKGADDSSSYWLETPYLPENGFGEVTARTKPYGESPNITWQDTPKADQAEQESSQ